MEVKNSYYLKHPCKQTFNRYLAFAMGLFCLNTERWDWYQKPSSKAYTTQRLIVLIFCPITCFSQVLYLYLHHKEHDFSTIAMMMVIMPIGFVVMVKLAVAQTSSYLVAMTAFMEHIHLYNYLSKRYKKEKSNYVSQKLIEAEKYTRWTCYAFMSVVLISCSAWNIVPLIHNIQNNDSIHNITTRLEVCIHFWQPFDYEFDFYAYLYIQVLSIYCGSVAVIILVLFDTINVAFIYHLVGHIKILKYDLRTGFAKEMRDEETKQKLVDISKRYFFITKIVSIVEAAFGLNIVAVYAQNLVQGGVLFYQLMTIERCTENILTYGLMIPIMMGVLVLISAILENVRIQADDIPALIYDLPWEHMSISNQKRLLQILLQTLPTLELRGAFNIKTGIQPAINILKTTFSYYVMIKANRM